MNLLVQYGNSESRDVQDMLARVARQLGVNINDVRVAAQQDAKDQADAKAAADKAAEAKKRPGPSKSSIATKKHLAAERARQAGEEYRRHRINSWWPSYQSRAS